MMQTVSGIPLMSKKLMKKRCIGQKRIRGTASKASEFGTSEPQRMELHVKRKKTIADNYSGTNQTKVDNTFVKSLEEISPEYLSNLVDTIIAANIPRPKHHDEVSLLLQTNAVFDFSWQFQTELSEKIDALFTSLVAKLPERKAARSLMPEVCTLVGALLKVSNGQYQGAQDTFSLLLHGPKHLRAPRQESDGPDMEVTLGDPFSIKQNIFVADTTLIPSDLKTLAPEQDLNDKVWYSKRVAT